MFLYILIFFAKLILKFIYFFIKLFPQKDKVVFISRQSNKVTSDFLAIGNKIFERHSDYQIKYLCKTLDKTFIGRLKYVPHMFVQMYHIATSKVVILDSYCIVVSVLKHKKNTKVIQMWHALGIFKKFAYSIIGKVEGSDEKIAEVMRMHKNYDYIISSSPFIKKELSEAYGSEEDKIISLGLPRMDFLTNQLRMDTMKSKIFEVYPEINNGKKIILYVPTFRKNTKVDCSKIMSNIDYEKFNLVVKLHNGKEMFCVNGNKIVKNATFTGTSYLSIADYVISDYSAIIFEAIIAKKKLYLYNYDQESYFKNRGIYIDYDSIPAIKNDNLKYIIEKIQKDCYTDINIDDFINKYVTNVDVNITDAFVDLIEKCMSSLEINNNELIKLNLKANIIYKKKGKIHA